MEKVVVEEAKDEEDLFGDSSSSDDDVGQKKSAGQPNLEDSESENEAPVAKEKPSESEAPKDDEGLFDASESEDEPEKPKPAPKKEVSDDEDLFGASESEEEPAKPKPAKRRRLTESIDDESSSSSSDDDSSEYEGKKARKRPRPEDKRIRKSKKTEEQQNIEGIEIHVGEFLHEMVKIAQADAASIQAGRPALEKLKHVREFVEFLHKSTYVDVGMARPDLNLVQVINQWLQPLPCGGLVNSKVRTSLLRAIPSLPINRQHLEDSLLKERRKAPRSTDSSTAALLADDGEDGDVVVQGYKIGETIALHWRHPEENDDNKALAQKILERWMRDALNKSDRQVGNVETVPVSKGKRETTAAAVAVLRRVKSRESTEEREADGVAVKDTSSHHRARIPFAVPFDFAKCPQNRVDAKALPNPNSQKSSLLKHLGSTKRRRR